MSDGTSASNSNNLFTRVLHQDGSLFTRKRVGFSIFGALAVVGSAAAINAATGSDGSTNFPSINTRQSSSQVSASVDTSSDSTSGSANESDSSQPSSRQSSSSSVRVTVNGQDVPVLANTSTTQTITDPVTGSQSTVETNNTHSDSGNSNTVNTSISIVNGSASFEGGSTQ